MMEAKIKAQAAAEVNQIEMEKQVVAKEAKKRMEEIENTIYLDKEKAKADANHYRMMKMIETEQA